MVTPRGAFTWRYPWSPSVRLIDMVIIFGCAAVPLCPVCLLLLLSQQLQDETGMPQQALECHGTRLSCSRPAENMGATFRAGPNVSDALREGGLAEAALAVWTTTPWTMPANLAVAVNDRMDYSLVQARGP